MLNDVELELGDQIEIDFSPSAGLHYNFEAVIVGKVRNGNYVAKALHPEWRKRNDYASWSWALLHKQFDDDDMEFGSIGIDSIEIYPGFIKRLTDSTLNKPKQQKEDLKCEVCGHRGEWGAHISLSCPKHGLIWPK